MIRLLRWFEGLKKWDSTQAQVREPRRVIQTVQRHERTILFGKLPPGSFDVCPLCGNNLGMAMPNPAVLAPAVAGPDIENPIPRQLHE